MAISEKDRDAILDAVAAWPADDQITLAAEILRRIVQRNEEREQSGRTGSVQRSTWEALYGAAANGREPPSDQQVEQWLDERRMKENGS